MSRSRQAGLGTHRAAQWKAAADVVHLPVPEWAAITLDAAARHLLGETRVTARDYVDTFAGVTTAVPTSAAAPPATRRSTA
jgi:hypothetical protein